MSGSTPPPQKPSTTTKQSLLNASKPFMKNKSQTTSSIVFPTFRFSPESEEIQEVTCSSTAKSVEDLATSDEQQDNQKASTSQGDTSPIKEYILKHKWANKWDKRSLSLDLDLKGKIITAIEDKRRSFVSHFYNEEDEDSPTSLVQSCSIPERLIIASSSDDVETSSVHSDSTVLHRNFNIQKEFNYDEFDFEGTRVSSSLPSSPAEFIPTNTITKINDPVLDSMDIRDLIIEEVGVDCCENETMSEDDEQYPSGFLRTFVLPPEALHERFNGLPTLYNPPSVIRNLRKYPINAAVSDEGGGLDEQVASDDSLYYSSSPVGSVEDLSFRSVVVDTVNEIVFHPWVKYWVGIVVAVIVLDLGAFLSRVVWFVLGGMGAIVVTEPFRNGGGGDGNNNVNREVKGGQSAGAAGAMYSKSQGWMLTYPSDSQQYSAFTYHLRNTKLVFIRLNGANLTISYPHAKHKLQKRRLWTDQIISTDHLFVRHNQYNLHGAKIEIIPTGLARKRVWCKKYPISITLACKEGYVGVKGGRGVSPHPAEEEHASDWSKSDVSVNYKSSSGDGERVSVNVGGEKSEVFKEECGGKVLYLFARTDREKDDWFRRLVHASKSLMKPVDGARLTPDLTSFIKYMRRACPTLNLSVDLPVQTPVQNNSPRSMTPTNDLWESVSTFTAERSSPSKKQPSTPSSSSKKSTPDKENQLELPVGAMNPTFLNALIGRLFYDFLKSPKWTHEIRSLIDRKLYFIRKPPFIQSLTVKELELGLSMPVIGVVSAPLLDKQGLWVDVDVEYSGGVVITIETFVNLLKLGFGDADKKNRKGSSSAENNKSPRTHAMFDSDADDSGESSESSEDDQDKVDEVVERNDRGKLYKYADSIAKSSVMRNKHVQKVVGNIAATPLLLTVEIKRIVGTLALNVPPVPNDRVWLGFRGNPVVEIDARPKFGERVVNISHLTTWIKKKIMLEFQRVMVCPNMMDITVPLMEFDLPK